ncbi:hypothetical protein [Frankia gtarii]|uniref:ABC transporter ATP-binding protein n=1 Tax=Frankia gtarii TaxID=2950102 RepID=UPI003F6827EB
MLHHGRLVETGSTEQVLAHPKHPYTQDLLAAVLEMRGAVVPPAESPRPDSPARIGRMSRPGSSRRAVAEIEQDEGGFSPL